MLVRARYVLSRLVPAAIILSLVLYAIAGDQGLLDYMKLRREAEQVRAEWARAEKDNDLRIFQIRAEQRDPVQLERTIADEMGYTRAGSTLYVFEGDEIVQVR